MSQPMPVVKTVYWPAIFPQVLVIALLAIGISLVRPDWRWNADIFLGALAYVVIARALRHSLAREHILGIRAYRDQRFLEARDHFRRSYTFFTEHPWIDWWRFIFFASTSQNPYRTLALCNEAFCETQIGDGPAAIALYEKALRVTPSCSLAITSLRMLRSTASAAPSVAADIPTSG